MAASLIYLDYAATSPLCEEAAAALRPYLEPGVGEGFLDANANSLHNPGRTAFRALEDARACIARAIGARPDEVIFTSCSSEADNAAIYGLAHGAEEARHLLASKRRPQVIVSAMEHDAVLLPAKRLEHEGFRVDILPVDRNGFVSCEALRALMTEDCVLVSIQWASGEVGTVQPVAQLAAVAHEGGALFHTDATQALGKLELNMKAAGVDAASFSGHKVGGPKGVGFLFLRVRTPFKPLILGGGQESGRRSGTQNVSGAVATAAAVEAACVMQQAESARLMALRDDLYRALSAFPAIHPTAEVPAGSADFLPNVVNVHVDGFEGPTLVLRLAAKGICVSGGSACSSASLEPSRVLTAMGIGKDSALGELRVSMGRYTQPADIDAFLAACSEVIGG